MESEAPAPQTDAAPMGEPHIQAAGDEDPDKNNRKKKRPLQSFKVHANLKNLSNSKKPSEKK